MIFDTSGEFVQALKDYKTIEKKAVELKEEYHRLYYLRYEKVRSPLDYDIVQKKKKDGSIEEIRQIKGRGTYNQEAVADYHEKLDAQIEKVMDEYSKLVVKMENTRAELSKFDEELRELLIMRYLEHMKLKDVAKKSGLYLDESGIYKLIMRGLKSYYE